MTMDLEKATAKELRQWRSEIDWETAPPGSREQLDDLIIEKTVTERVEAAQAKVAQKTKEQVAEDQAYKRWPELRDTESPFAKRTKELMEKDGMSILAAANETAFQLLGTASTRVPPVGVVAGGRSDANVSGTEPSEFLQRTSKLHSLLVNEGLLKGDAETAARIANRAEVNPYHDTGE